MGEIVAMLMSAGCGFFAGVIVSTVLWVYAASQIEKSDNIAADRAKGDG